MTFFNRIRKCSWFLANMGVLSQNCPRPDCHGNWSWELFVHKPFRQKTPVTYMARCIKLAFDQKSQNSNANWFLTNQNRALRICVWFFWFAFKHKFYATGPSHVWVTMQCWFVFVSLGLWVNSSTLIDWFTNIFKLYAYFLNRYCSWQPESLPEVCPT